MVAVIGRRKQLAEKYQSLVVAVLKRPVRPLADIVAVEYLSVEKNGRFRVHALVLPCHDWPAGGVGRRYAGRQSLVPPVVRKADSWSERPEQTFELPLQLLGRFACCHPFYSVQRESVPVDPLRLVRRMEPSDEPVHAGEGFDVLQRLPVRSVVAAGDSGVERQQKAGERKFFHLSRRVRHIVSLQYDTLRPTFQGPG